MLKETFLTEYWGHVILEFGFVAMDDMRTTCQRSSIPGVTVAEDYLTFQLLAINHTHAHHK